ncbi:carcinoembryonic antigen-related cell adhesion molecule 1-like isoform X2 [Acipenser ruthenus]|uniref:carcinoembryonic antigen-related cell adhesion molecule 1-like isoform X2 n=1 Tax=Acipenser ruthenus TaxID=7906 RepID=UPI002740696B|nr:carcinoembryonic antigen-related cell adhesion molecule 1-like isoform X2 [Acipenser ruthenus]
MENSQAALLTLGFLLFLKGCETLASERSTNLAVGVGEDVQLKINPPVAVSVVTWSFGSLGLFIVTWNGVSETVALPYQGRVELNKNTGTLTLKNVSRSDSGDYVYQAVNSATGHPVQYNGNIALNVYQSITNVNVKPSPAQPIANQALNLTCDVLGSQTVSSRLWLMDGQLLSASDRITLSVDSSVVSFNPVLQSDDGEYQCKASNSVSEVTSAGYRLEVYCLGSLSSGEIAGIVIGTLAGVTGVALGVYFSVKLCRNNPHDLRPGPAQSSPGSVIYENFKEPSASATYENTTAIRRAGLQFPDQSTYSTLNRP